MIFSEPHRVANRISELLIPGGEQLGLEGSQLEVIAIIPIGWFKQT